MDYSAFLETLSGSYQVAILSHVKPDGDCIGSQVALCRWLSARGVECTAFNEDPVPSNLLWLTKDVPILPLQQDSLAGFDAAVFCDGNSLARFSRDERSVFGLYDLTSVMIDHHPDPKDEFTLAYSDPERSSTCEMVADLVHQLDPGSLDVPASKALYTGMLTDTGSFQFESVGPGTLEAAARMLRVGGFRPSEIVDLVFSAKSPASVRLLGELLNQARLYENDRVAVMSLSYDVFQIYEEQGEIDTDGFVNELLQMQGVKAAIFFRESSPGVVKLSLRSKKDVDVNQWARRLNGGGHVRAAGAVLEASLEEAVETTLRVGRYMFADAFR